ncbi:hypothetical protein Cgig2_021588 [Carnegiea gigantea]|uniref:Uncharacterized protein n=1 Tax=Carnegiea gigantea TaxID=171969 RepID=A0A9Q1GGE1_9CARY|nr:hypothetical protein Cgig2_021588 [Carnegiea gigantea]
MTVSYRELTLLILSAFVRALFFTVDVPADLDFDNLTDLETMLCYHHMITGYGIRPQVLLPGRCNLLERNTTRAFRKWWSKMFIFLTCSPYASDSKRKRSDLFDTNISKDKGKFGSKPKLKIVRFGKPLEPFVPPMEGGSSRVKIPRMDVVVPATRIPATPIESIDELPVGVYEPTMEKVIKLPPEGAENIEESNDVNFKRNWHTFLCHQEVNAFNQLDEYHHLIRIYLIADRD